jgi:hypothetical protein
MTGAKRVRPCGQQELVAVIFQQPISAPRVFTLRKAKDKSTTAVSHSLQGAHAMKLSLVATALLALTTTGAFAQTIYQRKVDQQDRISQGVRSGELTARETRNLEGREVSINREEHAMRCANNGYLTGRDRAILNSRQNHVSAAIYRDKHNGYVR